MSEYIVKLPISGAADEFFKTHEMPDMTLYGYPLTGEIVRCRDCKHLHTVSGWFGTYVDKCYLPDPETGEILDRNIKKLDGFCSWGERKEA